MRIKTILIAVVSVLLPACLPAGENTPGLAGPALGMVFDSELRALRPISGFPGAAMLGQPLPGAWYRIAFQEVLELANLPYRVLATRAVVYSVIFGTRQSPGLLLGIAYAWWPQRRQRWWAFVRGKCGGALHAVGLGDGRW